MTFTCKVNRKGALVCRYLAYKLPNSDSFLRLPLINIRLKSKTLGLKTVALVDSGATTTFIPTELAEILELSKVEDEGKEIDAHGGGGHFKTWLTCLDTLEFVKGASVAVEFRNIRALVPTNPEAIPYVVLGRDYIFRSFDITFRERRERTVFRQSKA